MQLSWLESNKDIEIKVPKSENISTRNYFLTQCLELLVGVTTACQAKRDPTKRAPHFHHFPLVLPLHIHFSSLSFHLRIFLQVHIPMFPRFLTLKSDSLVPIISVNKISLKLLWEDIAPAMGFNALLREQQWQLTNTVLAVQRTAIRCQTLNCSTASFKSSCREVCRETYQSFCRGRSMSCGDTLARNLPFI